MENVKLQGFKTFLTEHFTALAVEVFGEVESMMEACYEENKRLKSMLHMVLSPEIKLSRIDADLCKATTTITRQQPVEPNATPGLETSEPLSKRPKEEMIECEINWDTEQQQWPGEVENSYIPVSVKDDPEEEVEKTTGLTEMPREVALQHKDSSATISACDNGSEREAWSSPEAEEAAHASLQVLNEDRMSVNQQTNPETTSSNPGAVNKKKRTGAATYNSKFNPKWEEEWPCITSGSTPFHFWCTVCRRELECRHSGRTDVVRHFKRDYHKKKLQFYEKLFGSSLKLNMAVIPKTGEMDKLEAQESGFDVEDMCADLGLWFKSSTNYPDDFRVFCDAQYMELLQNVNIKWLSLELAINHVLRLYKQLSIYFKSTDEKQGRGVRLCARFEDPMTEVHLLLYQALLPGFVEISQLFQRQEPCVHLLHGQITNFIYMLMLKFLKPETFKETSPEKVGYQDEENQLPDSELDLGLTTKAALRRLNEAGEINLCNIAEFYKAARVFLCSTTEFAVTKLPLNNPLLSHAVFVDFKKRRDCQLDDVLYFVRRYNHLLPFNDPKEQDNIGDEFLDYQAMEECEIPPTVWKDALVRQSDDGVPCSEHYRMDIMWAFLSDVRSGITDSLRFPRLVKVAQVVLCLPNSNADAERSFSLIGHNKTDTRNRLSLEGTLSSVMCIKMSNIEPCFKYEPPAEMVKNSKFAAAVYKKHPGKKS